MGVRRTALSVTAAVLLVAGAVAAAVVVLQVAGADDAPADGSAVAAVTTGVDSVSLPPKAIGPVRQPEPGFLGAMAAVPSVAIYATAEARRPMWSLPNPTHEGVPLSFTVIDRDGSRLRVRLPIRPNGSTGWVAADQVVTFVVPNHVTIDLSDRTVTAYHGDEELFRETVAVGSPSTPTPTGDFYVDISVAHPGGAYGDWMLSIAGFSDVLTSFGGGIGQIAMHGWSDESVMGAAVSNGCIRMPNAAITRLAPLAGVGTPVTIQD